jgi:predicted ATPase
MKKKTGGNPFFTGELIRSLAETHQLLHYIPGQGWQADIAKIRTISVTSEPQNTCFTVRFPIVNLQLDINKN